MRQLEFDFSDVTEIILEDRDGDRFTFDRYADRISAVRYFLNCTKTKAAQVLEDLEQEYLEQAIKITKMERGMDIK